MFNPRRFILIGLFQLTYLLDTVSCLPQNQVQQYPRMAEFHMGPSVVQRFQHPSNFRMQTHRQLFNLSSSASLPANLANRLYIHFVVDDKSINIHLLPNKDVFDQRIPVQVWHGRNLTKVLDTTKNHTFTRSYRGRVLTDAQAQDVFDQGFESPYYTETFESSLVTDLGWARLTVFEDPERHSVLDPPKFEGSFTVDDELYIIKTIESYALIHGPKDAVEADVTLEDDITEVVVIKSSEIVTDEDDDQHGDLAHPKGSSSDSLSCDTSLDRNPTFQDVIRGMVAKLNITQPPPTLGLQKRDSSGSCIPSKKIMRMGVVADCSYVSMYGGPEGAMRQILSDWNQASALYESRFNIALGIVSVKLLENCETNGFPFNRQCSVDYPIAQRLSDFSKWRAGQTKEIPLWHLMTRCNSGSVVGIAWLGTVCALDVSQSGNTFITAAAVSSASLTEWSTVAHEIGHNFGAQHDCTSRDSCPSKECCACNGCSCGDKFLMSPTSGGSVLDFSPCSLNQVCANKQQWLQCSVDPGSVSLFQEAICGNGIKDPGEECDCGPENSATCLNSKCCQPGKCKLKPTAKCDDQNELCCSNCQPKPVNTICRAARSICDVEEKCDGSSGKCPMDDYQPNLTPCQEDGRRGRCASGDCTSRDYQCSLRGVSLGVTKECPGYSNGCALYCQGGGLSCVAIGGAYYSDGTPCGYSGQCNRGQCQQDPGSAFLGVMRQNLGLFMVMWTILAVYLFAVIYFNVHRYYYARLPQNDQESQELNMASDAASLAKIPAMYIATQLFVKEEAVVDTKKLIPDGLLFTSKVQTSLAPPGQDGKNSSGSNRSGSVRSKRGDKPRPLTISQESNADDTGARVPSAHARISPRLNAIASPFSPGPTAESTQPRKTRKDSTTK